MTPWRRSRWGDRSAGSITRPTSRRDGARSVPAGGRWSGRCRAPAVTRGGGAFIETFIAPDMHLRPVGETVASLERWGREVRGVHGLRQHYVRTVTGWLERFEVHRPDLTALVGEEVMRVWWLYLVGRDRDALEVGVG
ncbi:MAG: class I SAM-dependent methyltransferase, partial [Nocardioidaceae bacterium]